MEPSSAPETPQLDPAFTGRRPPTLDAALGMGIFLLVLGVFFIVQSAVFVQQVLLREPKLSGTPFSLKLFNDADFADVMGSYASNGDVIARAALWSAVAGLAVLFTFTFLWKRGENFKDFLGLRIPKLKDLAKWLGIFILLMLVLETLAYFFPVFRTPFMEQVMSTSTDQWLMVLGAGLAAPVFEEFLLRGLAYGTMRHLMDKHAAIAICAGLFTVMHLQYDLAVMLMILPIGVVLGYARANSNSIWVSIALHAANNIASVFLPQLG